MNMSIFVVLVAAVFAVAATAAPSNGAVTASSSLSPQACAPTGFLLLKNTQTPRAWDTTMRGDIVIACGRKTMGTDSALATCQSFATVQDYVAEVAGSDAVYSGFAVSHDRRDLTIFFCRRGR